MKSQLLMSIAIVTSIGSVSLMMPSIAGSRFRPVEGQFTSRLLLSQQPNLVVFPEVGLAIPQPSGFTKAASFYGFEQAATSSSVVLSKIPGPFSAVTKGFNKETLATRGISLISKQSIKIDNQPGFLLQVSQSAASQKFLKWIATRRISAYPQTDIVAIKSTTEISIYNLTGWEIVANGKDKQTKAPLAVYQVMLFPKQGGYVVITGIVGDKQSQIYMPKFKAMALTYRNSVK